MPSKKRVAEVYSAFYSLGNLCLGLINGILGPSLLDLSEIYGIETDEASLVYTSRGVGLLVGGLMGSFAITERNSQAVLIASLLVEGISIILFPIAGHFWLLHVVALASGVAGNLFECCSYVMLADLWEKPTLYLQIYQAAYGLSTFVMPFACEPFLSQSGIAGQGKLRPASVSRIFIPYTAAGAFCVFLGICMVIYSRCVSPPLSMKSEGDEISLTKAGGREDRFNTFEIALVALLSTLILFSSSVETTFTSMLSPFVIQSDLHMDKSDGAFLSGVFRATFFGGRVLTVIGYNLSLDLIIMVSLAFLTVSSAILSLFSMSSPLVMWLSTAGLGLGLSSLFGSGVAWTCQYMTLKHWHMAVTMVTLSVGMSSPAFLAAPWIDVFPMILPYVISGLTAILWVNFGLMLFLVGERMKIALK